MRSISNPHALKRLKLLAGGAVLAAGVAAAVAPDANAAWSATTVEDTEFKCASDDCAAGGVGPVKKGEWVDPDGSARYPYPPIGRWKRTVSIQCKINDGYPQFPIYQVQVKDKNWTGTWQVNKTWIDQPVDDSGFPTC
jgi:hypothetical protein